jgi:transcriptional regulator with XRE-family HTH domain
MQKGELLKFYRKKAGMTQTELAERLDIHALTISRWESDIREPRASDIKKLCSVLNVSETELLNGPATDGGGTGGMAA